METVHAIILTAQKPASIEEDIDLFMRIFTCYTVSDWLDTNKVFDIGNFIAYKRPDLVSIGIRLNVQVNLFLRTIRLYSSDSERILGKIGTQLGCFALTERNAGVLSGLIVDCKFRRMDDDTYVIDGEKQYISQSVYADHGLVFVSNVEDKSDVRICLVDMNDNNIARSHMDLSSVGGLDLGKITFNNVKIKEENILDLTEGKSRMEILNGILYGRFMIAYAVIYSILGLIEHIEQDIEGEDKFEKLGYTAYLSHLKAEIINYISHLGNVQSNILESRDVFRVNCYKVYVVEICIRIFNKLHMMFGVRAMTYRLTYDTLILNKVAEGDTSVLRFMLINHHVKKGFYHMLVNDGLSYYEIANLSVNSKTRQQAYILEHFERISDIIIQSTIETMNIDV